MQKALSLVLLSAVLASACRTVETPRGEADLSSSARDLVIPLSETQGIDFNFCPDKRAFSINNALWSIYLSTNQYAHFKEVGPLLDKLGFGRPGEGAAAQKNWYILRLKRVADGLADKDDSWKTPAEREAVYKKVLAEYKALFNEEYKDNGEKAAEFEVNLVTGDRSDQKIIFFSDTKIDQSGKAKTFSTQLFYAEHRTLDFSIVSFRGTEVDETSDIISDAKTLQVPMRDMGFVHEGFLAGYQAISEDLIQTLEKRSQEKPLRLWITGHSLGAALSTVMTADILQLKEQGKLKNVELIGNYNLGSPRVGDAQFAEGFDKLTKKYRVNFVRIRNHQDLVTGVPFGVPGTRGYWHVGALAYFDAAGKLHYGDGWKNIELNSDILKSTPNNAGDHSGAAYWKFIKQAYMDRRQTTDTSCELRGENVPVSPFLENPAWRK